jgi:hypothetical protein
MPMRALIDLPETEYLDGEAYPKVSRRYLERKIKRSG